MTLQLENEDIAELAHILSDAEQCIAGINGGGDRAERFETCRKSLRSFHTTAAMLGLQQLECAGAHLEAYLDKEIITGCDSNRILAFTAALRALIDSLPNISGGNGSRMDLAEDIGKILSGVHQTPDFSRMERIVSSLGGRLVVDSGNGRQGSFQLHFDMRPDVLERMEMLLSPCDPDPASMLAPQLCRDDVRLEKILGTINRFMKALAAGDILNAQEVLLLLADQQQQAGLYNEIGSMARELHNSLKNFTQTLDPALRDIVEHKIPDSGNRLEHILQLTETAANTTLDNVEKMQKRNSREHQELLELQGILQALKPIGVQAQQQLSGALEIIRDLSKASTETRDDLITVLTAQDYQDLTGQIIMKIMTLLKDLELKLVNVIRAFGAKAQQIDRELEAGKELYGPAHKGKAESLHSQDDVDALLAEFGF